MKPYGRPRFQHYSEPPPKPATRNWKRRARREWKKAARADVLARMFDLFRGKL